jgi:hypothetical protein
MKFRHVALVSLVATVFLLSLNGVAADVVELMHDTGRPTGAFNLSAPYGHLISFSPPRTPWFIERIRIYGHQYGQTEKLEFVVEIWASNRSVLSSRPYPYSAFKTLQTWIAIPIPNIVVKDSFFVAVYTGSNAERGIFIACDNSTINEHSDIVAGKRTLTDWNEIKWRPPAPRRERVNWMIHVVGSTEAIPIATTATGTTKSQSSSSSLFGLETTQLLQIAGGGVAAVGAPIMGWMFKTRKRRFVSGYLTKIDSTYNEYFMNREECRKRLTEMKDEAVQLLKKGKVDEPHFTIIDNKLAQYLKDLA